MEKIKQLRKILKLNHLEGYIIPKNDEFFNENVQIHKDRLKNISNFTGSAGFAIILLKENYLFVDGRYTLQAQKQCKGKFKIITLPSKSFRKIIKKKLKIGFDPKLYTSHLLNAYFNNSNFQLKPLNSNLIDQIIKIKKNSIKSKAWLINDKNSGENYFSKMNKIKKVLIKNKVDMIFISAPECVNWLINIRGADNQFSPIVNAQMIVNLKGNSILFIDKKKLNKSIEKKFKNINIIDISFLDIFLRKIKKKRVLIDKFSCSIYYENMLKKNNFVKNEEDYTYYLKSKKNKIEIKNSINSHFIDGLALTKFLFWLKRNYINKNLSEIDAENKLLKFRKQSAKFVSSSFPTISATGPNGAVIHYRADKKSNRKLKKGDIYLVDSGGQYKFGTTDVTRTISLNNNYTKIKNIFTRVLKGHIAVSNFKLSFKTTGSDIDKVARYALQEINLDYPHGTGHGVGYFANVHEGPQAFSKNNKIKIEEGMIISNEPGYYLKNNFGIRIENLIYVKKIKNELKFRNLTLAPIDKSLIDKKILNNKEINWINSYHRSIFKKFERHMSGVEKKDLINACSEL